jgi:hypothetical protein
MEVRVSTITLEAPASQSRKSVKCVLRTAILGAVVGAGLVMVALGAVADRSKAFGQRLRSEEPRASDQLIAVSTVVDDKYQQLTVIDPRLRTLGVYHVELATGDIELRCVRNIHWDLQMEYYNGKGLMPPEIRSRFGAR